MVFPLLSGEWRNLFVANYVVEPEILLPFVPPGTEINLFGGKCYVSLFAFAFLNAKALGIPIPFHQQMTEVNLRFYVRSTRHPEREGVVFLKELIPRHAVAIFANTIYHEKYETVPAQYEWKIRKGRVTAEYSWKKDRWHVVKIKGHELPYSLPAKSVESRLMHQFWGFSKSGNKGSICFRVKHPLWKIYPVEKFSVKVGFSIAFGETFRNLKHTEPASVLLAEGSAFSIYSPQRLV